MKMFEIMLNDTRLTVEENKTILEISREQGVDIPTLCHDEKLKPINSCFLCVVEIEGARTLMPSCSTIAMPNMVIKTHSKKVASARKTALELLLSAHYGDCYAPCKINCPALTDVQGYVGLTAQGKFEDGLKLVKERIPFPSSIGRVCPAFCEDYCRRQYVEESIAIRQIKGFLGDIDLNSDKPYLPKVSNSIGKKVAIIGAGPAGLTSAYYLRQNGVAIDVYEKRSNLGGMLYYGIPSYRLPKNILKKEIKTIIDIGINIYTGKEFGKDFTINDLTNKGYDAIVIAVGAWKTRKMGIPNEDNNKVVDGIKFLEQLNSTGEYPLSGRVAIIGGGNTAFDCARSSLRLGADEVVMMYRRTKNEMPANDIEIKEAEEEGIKFELLTVPIAIEDNDENILNLTCQRMQLGEPDKSGRRRPVPIENSEFTERFDFVITAIGQIPDYKPLGELGNTLVGNNKWMPYKVTTGQTTNKNIFIAGDFATGAATVVEAIASGRIASDAILKQIKGESIEPKKEFTSVRNDLDDEKNPYYKNLTKAKRKSPEILSPNERKTSFIPMEKTFTKDNAIEESNRCLECGCMDIHQCSLKKHSDTYQAEQTNYWGDLNKIEIDDSNNFIFKDPSKCILCGRCVAICNEKINIGVYGYINRGFNTIVNPPFDIPMDKTDCISCGACIASCPVGAIVPKAQELKKVPLRGEIIASNCYHCSIGCLNNFEVLTDSIYEIHERNNFLCKKGRFFFPKTIPHFDGYEKFNILKEYKNAVVYASPSLSCEEYEVLKQVSTKMNWQIVNYYSQSTLWQAFAEQKALPSMDFFTNDIKEKTLVICAGDIENINEISITKLNEKKQSDTVIAHINNRQTLRLENLGAKYFKSINKFKEFSLDSFDEVVLLINPIDFDKTYGFNAALSFYNYLIQNSAILRTTLFSNWRNIYSFYDANKKIDFSNKNKIYIRTKPMEKDNYLLIDSYSKIDDGLQIGYPFQTKGTLINSKNQFYQNEPILTNNFPSFDKVLSKLFDVKEKTSLKKFLIFNEKTILKEYKWSKIKSFPEESLKEIYKIKKI